MAILFLIIGLVIYFIFNVVPITKFHYLIAYLGLALTLVSGIGITVNENVHFGMSEKTTTKVQTIKPATSVGQANLLVYEQVGSQGPKTYVYNGQRQHTQANIKTSSSVKAGYQAAKLVTEETRYEFKNRFYKLLFGSLGKENELKKRTNIFEIPSSWKALSTKEVVSLKKQMIVQAQAQNK